MSATSRIDDYVAAAGRADPPEHLDQRLVLLTASAFDLGVNLLVYDRKNDDELSEDDVDDLIEDGLVDVDFLVEVFRRGLLDTGAFDGH